MVRVRFSHMAPGLVAASLACTALSCGGHPVQRKLQGRWLGEGIENVDEELIPQAAGWVRGTSFDFSGDRLTVTVPAARPRSGEYKVVKTNRRRVRLAVRGSDGRSYTLRLVLDDEHSMRWMIGQGRAVVLKREL